MEGVGVEMVVGGSDIISMTKERKGVCNNNTLSIFLHV